LVVCTRQRAKRRPVERTLQWKGVKSLEVEEELEKLLEKLLRIIW